MAIKITGKWFSHPWTLGAQPDFLQVKFKETLPLEDQVNIYFRAGSQLEERGNLERSVDFYVRAGATDEAEAAIERVGLQLLKKGKTAELSR